MSTDQPAISQTDFAPLNRIRVETTLSRYPLHRLAKKGTITIDLQGDSDVKWEVTYNSKHGQPGPLAYKLDTLVVNRCLDELGRPLPEIVRIGSLSDICRSLGSHSNGNNIADIKRAFRQNAFTAITANIRGKTKTGKEKWFEVNYTRYSVVFTGEVLPDGSQADAVYIVLNPPYRELLNHVETRPLDYDYLKQLAPGPQRFYELLSFQVYGALASGRPRAKMLYSDYCKYAPQTRYPDFEHIKKQMYKVHLPHRKSGYITKVEYQEITDADGAANWEMFYTPGPKAFTEYKAFTNRQLPAPPSTLTQPKAQGRAAQSTLEFSASPDADLLTAMTRRGISEKKALELLAHIQPRQEVLDQLEYVDSLIANDRRGKLENPPGLYVHYIRENITPPPEFWSSRKRRLHTQAQQEHNTPPGRLAQLQLEYEEYRKREPQRYAAAMPREEYQQLFQQLLRSNRSLFKRMTPAELEELTERAVLAELQESGKVQLLSFDAFLKTVRGVRFPTKIPGRGAEV